MLRDRSFYTYPPWSVCPLVSQSVGKNVKILKIFPELYMASAMLVVNITPLSLRDAFKKKPYLRTLSQLGLTPPLHSHFGTSTIGTFELGFRPPPTYKNLGHIDKNFG